MPGCDRLGTLQTGCSNLTPTLVPKEDPVYLFLHVAWFPVSGLGRFLKLLGRAGSAAKVSSGRFPRPVLKVRRNEAASDLRHHESSEPLGDKVSFT